MPDVTQLNFESGSIGTNVIFGDNRKRAIELIDDDWTSPGTDISNGNNNASGSGYGYGNGLENGNGAGNGGSGSSMPPPAMQTVPGRGAKRMKGGVSAK